MTTIEHRRILEEIFKVLEATGDLGSTINLLYDIGISEEETRHFFRVAQRLKRYIKHFEENI